MVVIVALNVITVNRQLPWQDEVLVTSTAWSLAQSGEPHLSVLAQYPNSGSPVRFYGPVSYETAAALLRIFGLSLAPWRLACLAGVVLTAVAGALLVRVAGGDSGSQLLTALFLALVGMISRFLPGRWDYVTMGFFLLGMLPILQSIKGVKPPSLLGMVLGGACIALALGSSPRSLTLLAAMLASAVVTALVFHELSKPLLVSTVITSAAAFVVHSAILWPWGLTPFTWYSFVKKTSQGDSGNVTPLLGGQTWQLDVVHHKVTLVLLVAFAVIAALGMRAIMRSRQQEDTHACRLFLGIFALANLLQMLLLVVNAFSRPEFMLPPYTVAALCCFHWESLKVQRLALLTASFTGIALLGLLLQYGQLVTATLLSWDRRDPSPLVTFVDGTVPRGSVVYGPVGGYFYAVEQAGSKYLYTYEETTTGLISEPHASIGDKLDSEICTHSAFLMWPQADKLYYPQPFSMPQAVRERILQPAGKLSGPILSAVEQYFLTRTGPAGNNYGYPDTVIYRLHNIHACGDDNSAASHSMSHYATSMTAASIDVSYAELAR